MEWKNRKTHWHEAVSVALTFPFLKEVSQNCIFFDVVKFKFQEVSQNCFVFDAANFKIQEVSQNYFVFDVIKQVQKLRKSRRIASFSSLQIDKTR